MSEDEQEYVPARRTADLVVRTQDDETLVLDTRLDRVHCLDADATRVFEACSGTRTLVEVAGVAGVDASVAAACIDKLAELDLLQSTSGLDRRRFLRRSALVGGSLVALPAIQTVLSPSAFAAGASQPGPCVGVTVQGDATQVKKCTGSTKGKFVVNLNGCTQSGTYYLTFSYLGADGNTHTEDTAPGFLTADATGAATSTQQITGTFINSGNTTVTVNVYADKNHTVLLNTATGIVGC